MMVRVESGRLPKQLQRLESGIRQRWWQEYAGAAQLLVEREQRRRFSEQRAPDGTAWAPLSPLTLALSQGQARQKVRSGKQRTARVRRTGSSRILTDTGLLMRSVTTGGAGAVRRRTGSAIEVGTRVPYAAAHQFGAVIAVTPKMRGYLSATLGRWFAGRQVTIPARPFLGMSARGRKELAQAARWHMERVMRSL